MIETRESYILRRLADFDGKKDVYQAKYAEVEYGEQYDRLLKIGYNPGICAYDGTGLQGQASMHELTRCY